MLNVDVTQSVGLARVQMARTLTRFLVSLVYPFGHLNINSMPFLTANSLNRVMASLLNLMDDNQLTAALTRYPSYKDLKQVLLNVRISYIQGDQKVHRVIKEVGRKPASSQTFELDGQTVSIAEYWSRQYNVRLRHPEWPCVRVTKNAWIPIECCQRVFCVLAVERY